jgi:uncharacterized SAM-binding protein YcdF (DUF218 family)
MDYWISKLAWAVLAPSHILILFLVLIVFLPFGPGARQVLMGMLAMVFLVVMFLPVGDWALVPLERCEQRALPPQVDGAIALGGAIEAEPTVAMGETQFNDDVERFTAMLAVMRAYPSATIVYSGGAGSPTAPDFKEADYVASAALALGYDPSHIVLENKSHNTKENVDFTKPYFSKVKGQNWLIITSAYHMPRAMALFRPAGTASNTKFFPYTVDFKTTGRILPSFTFDLPGNLAKLDMATKEYTGMLYNMLMGRTAEFMACGEPPAEKLSQP